MTLLKKAGEKTWVPYLALTLAVFAAYANVYHNTFVWDDWQLIVYNDTLKHWNRLPDILFKTTFASYYRPTQGLLYFFIYQIFGLSEPAFHAANILLQAASTCFIYRLGCRLGFYPRAAFAAALLWGVHPLWIEVAAVMSGAADLLMVFFCLAGLLVLLPDFKQQIPGAFAPRKIALASLFYILALCSKETAVVFPALATVTLFLVSRERLKPAAYIKTWPLWLLGGAYIIGWLLCPALNNVSDFMVQDSFYVEAYKHNIINRILTSLATLPVYLGLMVTPAKLRIGWIFPVITTVWDWKVIGGAAIVAASLLQIIRGRGKQNLPLTWGLLWFAAALSPTTGILKPIDGQLFEHWIYLPAVGLFLGMSQTVTVWMETLRYKKAPALAAGLMVLATLVLGGRTYVQNEILHDSGSLFEDILTHDPSVWAHYQLGVYYFGKKEYEKAEEQWRTVEADGTYTQYLNKGGATFMHSSLAFIYLNAMPPSKGDEITLRDVARALPSSTHIHEAIDELNMVQNVDPEAAYVSPFLAAIYYYLGDKEKGDYYRARAGTKR